jgi:hypothetical protein
LLAPADAEDLLSCFIWSLITTKFKPVQAIT